MLCPEDRFRFILVPVHAGSGSNQFPVNRTRFPVPGLIPKFPEHSVWDLPLGGENAALP